MRRLVLPLTGDIWKFSFEAGVLIPDGLKKEKAVGRDRSPLFHGFIVSDQNSIMTFSMLPAFWWKSSKARAALSKG